MKTRLLLAATAVACAAVTVAACANDEGATDLPPQDPRQALPEQGSDGDAGMDGDAGPCDDCEHYPSVCSEDVLCLNGPFEPGTVGGAFDSRARVHTIQGRSVSDVWVAGALGMIAHFDGTAWSRSDPERWRRCARSGFARRPRSRSAAPTSPTREASRSPTPPCPMAAGHDSGKWRCPRTT